MRIAVLITGFYRPYCDYENNINVRIIGEDYAGKPFTGDELKDIKIYYNNRKHTYSSTELRKRIKGE